MQTNLEQLRKRHLVRRAWAFKTVNSKLFCENQDPITMSKKPGKTQNSGHYIYNSQQQPSGFHEIEKDQRTNSIVYGWAAYIYIIEAEEELEVGEIAC